jgi:hypothetical protein
MCGSLISADLFLAAAEEYIQLVKCCVYRAHLRKRTVPNIILMHLLLLQTFREPSKWTLKKHGVRCMDFLKIAPNRAQWQTGEHSNKPLGSMKNS